MPVSGIWQLDTSSINFLKKLIKIDTKYLTYGELSLKTEDITT